MAPLRVLMFGSCFINDPVRVIGRQTNALAVAKVGSNSPPDRVYSFGEVHQILDMIEGRRLPPAELRFFCDILDNFEPLPNKDGLDHVDVVLLEPVAPVDILLDGWCLNRNVIQRSITEPAKIISKEASKAAYDWYEIGIQQADEAMREDAASRLERFIPIGALRGEMLRHIVRHGSGKVRETAPALASVLERLPKPVGIVIYTTRFTEQGERVVTRPAFQEQVLQFARQRALKVFEPWRLVQDVGIASAMEKDFRHFSPSFQGVVGVALTDFCQSIVEAEGSLIRPGFAGGLNS